MSAFVEDRCQAVGEVRQGSELTEQNLVNWMIGLSAQAKFGQHVLACGSPAIELIARRIVWSDPPGPLYSIFDLLYEPELGPNEWQAAVI